MGAGQSSEGPRVVTVERGQGDDEDTAFTVTQDFINYIDSGGDESGKGPSYQPPEKHKPPEYEPYPTEPVRAEDLLAGSDYGHSGDAGIWKRLYQLETEKNKEYKKVTEENFEAAAKSVEEELSKSALGQLVPVCKELEDRVLNCYRNNPKKTLNCAHEVALYRQCVQRARKGTLVPSLDSQDE